MKIGFVGTGTIASAVVAGIAGHGHHITVSQRGASHAARLRDLYPEVTVAPNAQVVADSDVILLGLMADAAPGILQELDFRTDQRVISLMAGLSLSEVGDCVAPAKADAIMIPFPGIARGGSPVMLLGEREIVDSLFGVRNQVFQLESEEELSTFLSAQAVLSPAVQMVSDASDWLGQRVSDPTAGEAFLRALVGSSLLGDACAPLLKALDTPGGYNQRLRRHMQDRGMASDLAEGLDALAAGPD